MKKVLITMMNLGYGGAEKSLVNLINELPKDKYKVDLLLFKKEGMFLKQLPDWVDIIDASNDIKSLYAPVKKSGKFMPVKILGTIISRIFEREERKQKAFRWKYFYSKNIKKVNAKYDVAVAYISGEVLYFVGEKINADKKIVWIHNDYRTANHPKKYDYAYLAKMDTIVSISEHCVDILKEEFPEFKDKIYCVKNITSSHVARNRADEFTPKEFDYSVCRILSVGRLMEQKGFDMAIKAATLLKSKGLKFKWYIVGNGELQKFLEKQIQEKDVSDCFILLGSRENPYVYMKNCTILVQPSRYEGKSVVLDEAKILAKPIVATNYPTVRDQLNDEEGLVVEMSPEGIAQGIIEMLDESKRQAYSKYLSVREYGNEKDIQLYYDLLD